MSCQFLLALPMGLLLGMLEYLSKFSQYDPKLLTTTTLDRMPQFHPNRLKVLLLKLPKLKIICSAPSLVRFTKFTSLPPRVANPGMKICVAPSSNPPPHRQLAQKGKYPNECRQPQYASSCTPYLTGGSKGRVEMVFSVCQTLQSTWAYSRWNRPQAQLEDM